MQIDGTLTKWNKDRGFGFITPRRGGDDVFIHITAFPRDGQQPRIGEVLSFDLQSDKKGRRQAVNVFRPGSKKRQQVERGTRPGSTSWIRSAVISLLTLTVIVGYAFYNRSHPQAIGQIKQAIGLNGNESTGTTNASFRCDGRTHCSQMTSCDEAKFFLNNCPGTKMDGNGDGVPCENQWCGY